jgi:hypothetical protein
VVRFFWGVSSLLKHFPKYCELLKNGEERLSLAESRKHICGFGLHLFGKCPIPAKFALILFSLSIVLSLLLAVISITYLQGLANAQKLARRSPQRISYRVEAKRHDNI